MRNLDFKRKLDESGKYLIKSYEIFGGNTIGKICTKSKTQNLKPWTIFKP